MSHSLLLAINSITDDSYIVSLDVQSICTNVTQTESIKAGKTICKKLNHPSLSHSGDFF